MTIPATRRRVLLSAVQIAGSTLPFAARLAHAETNGMAAAIDAVTKGATITPGRVTMDMPALVENGNVVPLLIKVESPMTPADYVEWIHVFNEKNPQPEVIALFLGPRAGRAEIATRIKLADTQRVTAIARMSDGTLWSTTADVIVTIAACIEDLQ